MVNTTEFIQRMQKVIDFYGLSGSSFADKIGVQRSSISHILSGRNKPSLEFIMKVLSSFPEVDLYWLLNGKGSFPNTNTSDKTKKELASSILKPIASKDLDNAKIDRIVIFFKNGNFKNFEN